MDTEYGRVLVATRISANGSGQKPMDTGCIPGQMVIATKANGTWA